MRKTAFIVFLFLLFAAGCKTPQNTLTNTKKSERKDIANDITLLDTSELYEAIYRGIETAIREKLKVSVNQKIYDTDKPIDPGTGKPPLKEENNIDLSKETDTQVNDSTSTERSATNNSLFTDKTKDKSKADGEEKTKTERTFSQIEVIAICIAAGFFIGLIIYAIRKFKK